MSDVAGTAPNSQFGPPFTSKPALRTLLVSVANYIRWYVGL
jgi:hypothetical protein